MLFRLSHDDLVQAVGDAHVYRITAEVAQRYGFRDEAVDFLVNVGVPAVPDLELLFKIGPDFDAEHLCSYEQLLQLGWQVSPDVSRWVKLGYFPISMVAIDPVDGVVYQFAEGSMRPSMLHADLSSFVKTIISAAVAEGKCSELSDEEDAEVLLNEYVSAVRVSIQNIDPLPFENPHNEWNEIFGNLEAGIYA
ncbi:SUKH-4 family immunity protein [Streptomyces sp. TRM49041]|uniref:SUKH-4 family immunity protein n=1 Tax=Streptomyces sp. TRM49041 TaxID=2603216 RepID=UPI0021CCCFEE|nr:SUKH-4 family immunity protein [Streptomyces sp. TRM49041]